jgi:hypothetical protein
MEVVAGGRVARAELRHVVREKRSSGPRIAGVVVLAGLAVLLVAQFGWFPAATMLVLILVAWLNVRDHARRRDGAPSAEKALGVELERQATRYEKTDAFDCICWAERFTLGNR